MKSVTQGEIARRLGLSQPVVGRVLGKHSSGSAIRVGKSTRQRIMKTARDLGYRPNRHAQITRGGKTGTIALIQFGGLLYVNELRALHAARAIRLQGYHVLHTNVLWHAEGVQEAFENILDARAEGLVLVGAHELVPCTFVEQLRRSSIPVVSLSSVRFPRVPQVRADALRGMYDVTQHVLRSGRRRLLLLAGGASRGKDERYRWTTTERVEGFRRAATEAGLGEDDAEVVFLEPHPDWLLPPAGGKLGMERILRRPNRPDAVICASDNWAFGALSACAEAGVRVPDDLAITGFDNDMLGEFSVPPLTTVEQPIEAMAVKAVEMVVAMIRKEIPVGGEDLIRMPCRLVVRKSCGGAALSAKREFGSWQRTNHLLKEKTYA